MLKLVYCIRRKSGLTREEFSQYWSRIHGPLGARIPGLRRLVQSQAIEVPGDTRTPDFDGVVELWFDDVAALLAARQSPEWAAATADEANFVDATQSAYLVTVEREII